MEAPDFMELKQLCDFAETRLNHLLDPYTAFSDSLSEEPEPPTDWEWGCLNKTRNWVFELEKLTPADEIRIATETLAKQQTPISAVLTISTAHITEATALAIAVALQKHQPPFDLVVFAKGEYGWWIYVSEDNIENPDIPDELEAAMRYAHCLGCEWLCLDQDAPTVPELTTFDW